MSVSRREILYAALAATVQDVRLKNCAFANVAGDSVVKNVRGLTSENVKINGRTAP